jgi:hypothetical protein
MDDDRHQLSMTILMTPHMSNSAGDVHGGGRRRRCVETRAAERRLELRHTIARATEEIRSSPAGGLT